MNISPNTSIRTVLPSLSFAILSSVVPGTASAQQPAADIETRTAHSEFALRSSGAISMIQTRPQGALGQNIGLGYGVNGAYLLRMDHDGVLSLRADLGVVSYGSDVKRTAFSESVGDRVEVNVRTTNYIVPVSVGPQLTRPTGTVRPYVNVGVGGQWFATESEVENRDAGSALASSSNQSAFAAAWSTGAGVYVPIKAAKANLQFDFGVKYVNGAQSRYLAPGGIADLPNGRIKITSMQSSTHLLMLNIGARIGL